MKNELFLFYPPIRCTLVNSVNSFNSYSAVLPPSPMVFFVFEIRTMRPEIFLTWEVTSLKNCRKAPVFNGKLSCGVLEIESLLKNIS